MARAAVIPQSPPKRATRGRGAKGSTAKTNTAASKASTGSKNTKTAAAQKKNTRAPVAQMTQHADSEDETEDEIDVVDNKSQSQSQGRKTTAPKRKGSAATTTTTGRGRKGAAAAPPPPPEPETESENEEDELAQSDAPKKRAGRPKAKAVAKEEGNTLKAAATSRGRGRPKGGAASKTNTEDDILKVNTRLNSRQDSSEDSPASQQGPTQVFITTASSMMRGPAKTKKKVTFRELSDSDETELSDAPAPTTRRRRGTIVAKDEDGMGAKPVRKAATGSTRGRKPAAAKKGAAKPLSPKKATQVAKAISAYASSDGEDDELNGDKDAIKLVVHSPQKQGTGLSGLSSPVRRINFTPNKSNHVDENGEPNLPRPKQFDFSDSQYMSSPARRPPPSPFHFTLKETPKRGGLGIRETTSLTRPESTPVQDSPLRKSARKAHLGTPGQGSMLGHGDGISQPNFSASQNSPLKASARKAKLGTPGPGSLLGHHGDSIAAPTFSASQNSPLKASARKANLGTPGPGSMLRHHGDSIAPPNFTPSQSHNSPLKTSPKKGLFGTSFSSQQPQQQNSTPFKASLLVSPAKKVSTPFKNSATHVPSSLAQESHLQPDVETDDETVSMYDESPLRDQNFEGPVRFEENEEDPDAFDPLNVGSTPDGSPVSRTDHLQSAETAISNHGEEYDDEEEQEISDDELAPLEINDLAEDQDRDEEEEDIVEDEAELKEGAEEPYAYEENEEESTTPKSGYEAHPSIEEGEDEDAQYDELVREVDEEPEPSPFRYSFTKGLEDVFMDSSIHRQSEVHDDAQDENEADEDFMSEEEDSADARPEKDEPTLVGEAAKDQEMDSGPIQPYEIEEIEHTPFVNFLLTHWAPTLPFVDECEPPSAPVDTDYRSPQLDTTQEDQNAMDSSPFMPVHSEQDTPVAPKHSRQSSPSKRGPRFTLLAEQFGRWQASSPAKPEPKPRRRGMFSLGRTSGVSSAASRAPAPIMDIFANAPTLSARPRSPVKPPPSPIDIHEDKEDDSDDVKDETTESRHESPTRSPMTEIMDDEASNAFDVFQDGPGDEGMEEPQDETANDPIFEPQEDKENEGAPSIPATPAKNPALPRQTFHTVSKVPLKPEGDISPLKISRKRGRSLSITSPARSSAPLTSFDLPPQEHRAESPPRKSPRLQYGSPRKSVSRQTPRKSVEPQPTPRARTPSRSASPSKTPRKSVSAYSQCLEGAVVFVDVHTTEGEDASGIFAEVLQQMGARCIRNWSWNPRMSVSPEEAASSSSRVGITHVVFKDGGVRTLEKVRQAAGLVKCVGVAWVLDCERQNQWLDESPYAVDSSIIPRGGAKRRKSMEPRALSNVNGTLVKGGMAAPSSARKSSAGYGNASRSATPDDRSTPDDSRGYEPGHTEPDQKYWQTPKTPSAAALGYNFDSIGMSPATPFYLNQRSKLVQQTCPPKQTRQGLFTKTAAEEGPSRELKAKLEAARRKSLAFKPTVGSPLVE